MAFLEESEEISPPTAGGDEGEGGFHRRVAKDAENHLLFGGERPPIKKSSVIEAFAVNIFGQGFGREGTGIR